MHLTEQTGQSKCWTSFNNGVNGILQRCVGKAEGGDFTATTLVLFRSWFVRLLFVSSSFCSLFLLVGSSSSPFKRTTSMCMEYRHFSRILCKYPD